MAAAADVSVIDRNDARSAARRGDPALASVVLFVVGSGARAARLPGAIS
jgi:hypothetical protein